MAIELPLFPLNVVLFPGADLPLHIFEARYRLMINECYQQEKPFGVVLARPQSQQMREEPYPIGTMAEILALSRMDDGRMNLIARGGQRFRILDQHREKPYLTGIVEVYKDLPEPEPVLREQADKARELFNTYLEILLEVIGKQETQFDLPAAPEELSHFIASFLDIEDEAKQRLLEMTLTTQRLESVIVTLRREVPFVRQMLSMSNIYRAGGPDRSRLN
ncbi:MAG TPA: LON peptidase substrate-binding domain-containing protein [Ktedonobacteraceae bacterium]|nr:LON peptidase substrate-binding domain-containing protein [Ktedonobacteraceae bacterium]